VKHPPLKRETCSSSTCNDYEVEATLSVLNLLFLYSCLTYYGDFLFVMMPNMLAFTIAISC
jgi:hypothetical protein